MYNMYTIIIRGTKFTKNISRVDLWCQESQSGCMVWGWSKSSNAYYVCMHKSKSIIIIIIIVLSLLYDMIIQLIIRGFFPYLPITYLYLTLIWIVWRKYFIWLRLVFRFGIDDRTDRELFFHFHIITPGLGISLYTYTIYSVCSVCTNILKVIIYTIGVFLCPLPCYT